jgi:hypothetical protein
MVQRSPTQHQDNQDNFNIASQKCSLMYPETLSNGQRLRERRERTCKLGQARLQPGTAALRNTLLVNTES